MLPSTDRPASDVLLRKFGNATQLVGEITIVGTDVVDLSFLRNVGKIIPSYLNVKGKTTYPGFVFLVLFIPIFR